MGRYSRPQLDQFFSSRSELSARTSDHAGCVTDFQLLLGQEFEGVVGDVFPCDAFQKIARLRTGDGDAAPAKAHAFDPVTENLPKPEMSMTPTPVRTALHSAPTWSKSVERRHEKVSSTPAGAYQSGTSSPKLAPICAPSPRWVS